MGRKLEGVSLTNDSTIMSDFSLKELSQLLSRDGQNTAIEPRVVCFQGVKGEGSGQPTLIVGHTPHFYHVVYSHSNTRRPHPLNSDKWK